MRLSHQQSMDQYIIRNESQEFELRNLSVINGNEVSNFISMVQES
jgi:hypothetical protein